MITLLSFLFYLVHKDNIQWICIPFSQKCRFSSDFAFLTPESLHSHFWVFSSGQINLKGFHLETNSHIGSVLKLIYFSGTSVKKTYLNHISGGPTLF